MISMNDIKRLRVNDVIVIKNKSREDDHLENVFYKVIGSDNEKVAIELINKEVTPMISNYSFFDHIDLKTGIMDGNLDHNAGQNPINIPTFVDDEYMSIYCESSEQMLSLIELLNS